MKQFYTLLAVFLLTAPTWAQSPEKMSYQAVVRDVSDVLVQSQPVGMQISILQGSASGTVVYTETQTATTNVNGLLSIEIGAGTTSDDFTTIDWATGTYFIKTETDPAGGTAYSITGTSQLLSVPYALHAKTAGSVTEVQTLADVVVLGNTVNNQLKSVTNPTEAQDAATKAYVDALEAKLIALESSVVSNLKIGDKYKGGVVFYLDGNGGGLVCALSDFPSTREWGCYGTDLSNVPNVTSGPSGLGAEIGDGMSNTNNILYDCPTAPAALAARSYGPEWFLPSAKELNQMYVNKATLEAVAGFTAFQNYYWSSTEILNNFAWNQSFFNGYQNGYDKNGTFNVRAVRAF
jgi:hypothetical protein